MKRLLFLFFLLICFPYFLNCEWTQKLRPRSRRDLLPEKGGSSLISSFDDDSHTPKSNVVGSNGGRVAGSLPLPADYNKLVIPLGNVSSSIFVEIYLSIREILDVDTKNEVVELDTELGVSWIDWGLWQYLILNKNLKLKENQEEIILDAGFLNKIWKPDIYIDEMAMVERTSLLSKLVTIRYLVTSDIPGTISFISRQTVKLRCDMNFRFYPADIQTCSYKIRSYSYPDDQLFLLWNPRQSVYLDATFDSNFDFQVSGVEPGNELRNLLITAQAPCCNHLNFSALSFDIKIRRNLTYHLVQTYLPSILLILITWLCFLLPSSLVEVRIGISMTTVLTLTAMFTAVREQSPEVSYTMAIDVWMVFCIFLVFIALVLFTVIYWMGRRLKKVDEMIDPVVDTITKRRKYAVVVRHTKKYAFWMFALIFILFLTSYSVWLFQLSEYRVWEPSVQYNAIQMEGRNDSNRLFTTKEDRFGEKVKKKIVTNDIRFVNLIDEIIFPVLEREYGQA